MCRVLRVGVIDVCLLCPKRQRPSLEQYRGMYNFDGYFLLVSSSTMTYYKYNILYMYSYFKYTIIPNLFCHGRPSMTRS